jgi:hypothetical protein
MGCLAKCLDAVDAVNHRLADNTEVYDIVKEEHGTGLALNELVPSEPRFLIILIYY